MKIILSTIIKEQTFGAKTTVANENANVAMLRNRERLLLFARNDAPQEA